MSLSGEFSFDKLRNKFGMIQDVTKIVLDKFRASDKKTQPVDICHFFMKITGEVVFRIFFGTE